MAPPCLSSCNCCLYDRSIVDRASAPDKSPATTDAFARRAAVPTRQSTTPTPTASNKLAATAVATTATTANTSTSPRKTPPRLSGPRRYVST